MSDRSPYDDGETAYGRRGRRRASEPDPYDDGRRRAPESDPYDDGRRRGADRQPIDPYGDYNPYVDHRDHRDYGGPRTDPWRSAPGPRQGDPSTGPLTDPWARQSDPPPPGPSHHVDPDRPPPRWEDTQGARPRGRRHRDPADGAGAGPATGPQPYAPADDQDSRGRRRRSRSEHEADEHLAWSRSAPGEPDEDFQPVQPRVLDFDSVPVRRKRPRGEEPADEPRGGRRRRSPESGSFPAVSEPDSSRTEEARPGGRRRRSPDSGAFPAVEDPATGRPERRGGEDEPRGGGRRRRHDAGASASASTAAFDAAPPRTDEEDDRASRRPRDGSDPRDDRAERRGRASRRRSRKEPAEEERDRPRRGRRPAPVPPDHDEFDDPDERPPRGDEDEAPPADEHDGTRRSRRSAKRSGASRARSARRSGGADRRRRPRKGMIIVLSLVLVVALAAGGYVGRGYLFPPDYEGQGSGSVQVKVEQGASGSGIAAHLADEGIVASPRAFLNALDDHDGSIAPGTYELRKRMSGEAAVSLLMDPSSRLRAHITFKEGLRADEIMELISKETGIPMKELRAASEDGEKLGLPGYAEQGAEGYLFPDTYDMPPNAGAAALLKRMVDRYYEVADKVSLKDRAKERNLTPNEAMAVAAIVQAESGSTEDMPKIARVVYNRLEKGMELGMDSTCFYVLDEYGIALNSQQLAECKSSDSEYATYGRTGLPAGPIVSPGRNAIEAALEPADGDWLYFVATDPQNGVTEFAETHQEFLQLKQEFQQNRGQA